MKALILIISMMLTFTMSSLAQQSQSGGTGNTSTEQNVSGGATGNDKELRDTDGALLEPQPDPRKALSSRPIIVKPAGKVCKDSLLRSINNMDIPNQGQFPNPDNPNGYNDGTLNNNNGELPERMNCNAINDIAPREEPGEGSGLP